MDVLPFMVLVCAIDSLREKCYWQRKIPPLHAARQPSVEFLSFIVILTYFLRKWVPDLNNCISVSMVVVVLFWLH